MRTWWVVVGILLALPSGASAQVAEGTRVRLQAPCAALRAAAGGTCRIAGTLLSATRDSVVLEAGGARSWLATADIRAVEIGRGQRSYRLAGAAIGLVAGAGATWLVVHSGGSTAPCDRSANQDALRPIECAGIIALGGLAGAGVGALLGGLFRSERWESVPVRQLTVGVAPGTLRLGLALRLD